MDHLTSRVVWSVAGLALLVGLLLLLRSLSRTMAYPGARFAFPPPEFARTARAAPRHPDGGRAFAPGGLVLERRPGRSRRPLLPRKRASRRRRTGLLAAALAAGGVDAVLAEYRGYGGMPGRPSEAGLVADGEAVLAALRADGVTPARTRARWALARDGRRRRARTALAPCASRPRVAVHVVRGPRPGSRRPVRAARRRRPVRQPVEDRDARPAP